MNCSVTKSCVARPITNSNQGFIKHYSQLTSSALDLLELPHGFSCRHVTENHIGSSEILLEKQGKPPDLFWIQERDSPARQPCTILCHLIPLQCTPGAYFLLPVLLISHLNLLISFFHLNTDLTILITQLLKTSLIQLLSLICPLPTPPISYQTSYHLYLQLPPLLLYYSTCSQQSPTHSHLCQQLPACTTSSCPPHSGIRWLQSNALIPRLEQPPNRQFKWKWQRAVGFHALMNLIKECFFLLLLLLFCGFLMNRLGHWHLNSCRAEDLTKMQPKCTQSGIYVTMQIREHSSPNIAFILIFCAISFCAVYV